MLNLTGYTIIALASLAAGAVNALAGGGTLITFPTLTALGVPPVAANMTNTVALCPGYLGGSLAQRQDLRGQEQRLWLYIPASIIGGLAGAVLLQVTPGRLFRALVPYLVLTATLLLAFQEGIRGWLTRRSKGDQSPAASPWRGVAPVVLSTVYGGYFGAGLGVVVLAVLGLTDDDSLTRLNAVKQVISLSANVAAAVFFLFSPHLVWPAALVMFAGALLGGTLGGKLAGRVKPGWLRRIVVAVGVVVAVIYFFH